MSILRIYTSMAPAQSTLSSTGAGSWPPVVLKWCIVTKRRGKCYLRFLEAEEQLTVPELMCHIATLCQCKATLSACERVWGCLQLPVVDTIVLAEVRLLLLVAIFPPFWADMHIVSRPRGPGPSTGGSHRPDHPQGPDRGLPRLGWLQFLDQIRNAPP